MAIQSTETQLRRSQSLADMTGVARTKAEVVTITPPANTLLVRIAVCFK